MDDLSSLHKIQISGPTLASLLHRFSSSPADFDGLLFGRISHLSPSSLSDDPSPSDDHPNLIATVTVTSFFSAPSLTTFHSPSSSLHHLITSSPDPLIGWFSGRRKTPLRPSMRESSLTLSLSSDPTFNLTNCIFILLTTPFQDQLIHTHEYKAFQFRSSTGLFEAKTLDVINLGPAFRGHYGNFTPNSRFPELPFEVKGLGSESMVEDEGKVESDKFGLVCDEGFNVGRLKGLMGSEAAGYTAELEELYGSMIKKMNALAGVVEQSSARLLEQEKHNMKLRCKVAGIE